jgi:hypothetical protein
MIDSSEEDNRKDFLEHLIEIGAVEIVGYDSISDQFTYNLTPECEYLVPALWDEHFKTVNELAFSMWSKGLIEMNFDKDGTAMVMLKEETVKIKDSLPDEERFFIENLLRKHNNGDII